MAHAAHTGQDRNRALSGVALGLVLLAAAACSKNDEIASEEQDATAERQPSDRERSGLSSGFASEPDANLGNRTYPAEVTLEDGDLFTPLAVEWKDWLTDECEGMRVPKDEVATGPPIRWKPCVGDAPGCQELEVTSETALAARRPRCETLGVSEPARALVHTFADYLALEAYSNVRHEFLDASILAMAWGTPEHAALCAAVSGLILQRIMGTRCGVFSSDLRVRVIETGLATYPDVSVACSPREVDAEDKNTVTNPRVLVEVTSPSSEEYDLGEKREHYQRIAALQEYVVVSHRERRIELWRRQGVSWIHTVARAGESVALASIDASLEVDQVYQLAAQAE